MRILLLIALMLGVSTPVFAEDSADNLRTISVSGEAKDQFAPDRAEITVVMEGRAKTVAEAKKKHDELLNGLLAETKKFAIPEKQVKTLSDTIQPQYDYIENQGQRLREYSAEHRVMVQLDDTKKVGDFINAIVARGIDRVEGVNYTLKDSSKAEREVLLKAVIDAKAKATAIAVTLGQTLGPVQNVSATGGGFVPVPMPYQGRVMAMKAEAAMDAAAPVPAGEVQVNQTVQATFLIN
jgi:uncharacterized protein